MTWSPDTLAVFADAEEIEISSFRADGTLRPGIVIWAVAANGSLYVRSAHGPENGWFRRAVASGRGSVSADSTHVEVAFAEPDESEQAAVDAAYRKKYAHYESIVRHIVGPSVYDVTLRVDAV